MEAGLFKRILVATDFSELADHALETAIGMGRVTTGSGGQPSGSDAVIDLVHVYAEPTYLLPPPVDLAPWEDITTRVMGRIEESLQERARRVREAGLACETVTMVGNPPVEIVRRAGDTRADLIVLGTHGRGGLQHVLLGSTAERVVHRSRCPVLVVPVRQHGV